MTKAKRTFEPTQIRTFYRGWTLIATDHGVTGKKGNGGEHFEIGRLKDIETAIRMGKNKVNRLEGEEVWETEAPAIKQ